MANVQKFFMAPEDEAAFFRFLERFVLEVYPRRVPPDWEAFRASAESMPQLPEEDLYLVATEIGARHRGQGEARTGQGLLAHRRGALARHLLRALRARTRRASCSAGSCGRSWR